MITDQIDSFIYSLENQLSSSSLESYRFDLLKFEAFLNSKGIFYPGEITDTYLRSYLFDLEMDGYRISTIRRSLSSIRKWSEYLFDEHFINENFTKGVTLEPPEKANPQILKSSELNLILENHDKRPGALRDRCMVMLLAGTDIRVGELLNLRREDLDIEYSTFRVLRGSREITFAVPREYESLIEEYMKSLRTEGERSDQPLLFPGRDGKVMTRQGFLKNINALAKRHGVTRHITLQMIKNHHRAARAAERLGD